MREIKFRFWDGVRQEMFNEVTMIELHWECEEDPTVYVGKQFDYGNGRRVPRYSDGALMQFTGLRDRNGTEIYEGDILATWNDHPEFDHWNKGDYGHTVVEWDSKYTCYHGSEWMWEMNPSCESVYDIRFVEVIGNIYENAELLKDTDSTE